MLSADGLQFVKYIMNVFTFFSKKLSFKVQELMQYFFSNVLRFFFFSF